MEDPRAEALAARLADAAQRLKAAPAPSGAASDPTAGLAQALERLEAAGAAVRDARRRLVELEARLPAP